MVIVVTAPVLATESSAVQAITSEERWLAGWIMDNTRECTH